MWLVENHYNALEASLAAEYGLHLGAALWGDDPLSCRRLYALVEGLPSGSALHRALDPDGFGSGWGTQEELLATVAELIDNSNRLFLQANSERGTKLPPPIDIRRPAQRREQAKSGVASAQQVLSFFSDLKSGEMH